MIIEGTDIKDKGGNDTKINNCIPNKIQWTDLFLES